MICGKEPVDREQIIARYLARSLDVDAVEEFEGHYLGCDECFDELRVSDRLVAELRSSNVSWKQAGGVSILQFRTNAELTQSARELDQLRREVLEQSDSRVIIDLGRITKIDSAGLGQLMGCYSHLIRNAGSMKIVNARPEICKILEMTGISMLLPNYSDEQDAVRSFDTARPR
jgi:anti-sigma B factor antagonist